MSGKYIYAVPELSNNKVNMLMSFSYQYNEIKKKILDEDFIKFTFDKPAGMPESKSVNNIAYAELSRKCAYNRLVKIIDEAIKDASNGDPLIEKTLRLIVTECYSAEAASIKIGSIIDNKKLWDCKNYYLIILDKYIECFMNF